LAEEEDGQVDGGELAMLHPLTFQLLINAIAAPV
jgi:hypothetical protein